MTIYHTRPMTIYLQFYFSSSSSVYLHDSKHVSKSMTTIAGPHRSKLIICGPYLQFQLQRSTI